MNLDVGPNMLFFFIKKITMLCFTATLHTNTNTFFLCDSTSLAPLQFYEFLWMKKNPDNDTGAVCSVRGRSKVIFTRGGERRGFGDPFTSSIQLQTVTTGRVPRPLVWLYLCVPPDISGGPPP